MKVLIDHPDPFLFTHGGFQIQIEQTKLALEANGVDVEPLRWWDRSQQCDIIHYFGGRVPEGYIRLAQGQGIKLVMSELMSNLSARRPIARKLQKCVMELARRFAPQTFTSRLAWESFRLVDACIAMTPLEAHFMQHHFGAPAERVHVVPNGVEDVFLQENTQSERGPWLICTATIRPLKRVLELAQAAVLAKTQVWILGKPYSEEDRYALAFRAFAKQHPDLVRYEGPVNDRIKLAQIYRQARGFVLLSTNESLSLSALEAAACGCPLLLSDLPWARCVFKDQARYCPITSVSRTAEILRHFSEQAPDISPPPKPLSWREVAVVLKGVYEKLLR
ncbi:MAG TPA: glycosyltransferase family 4 protein [Verrucomicrobiae bacterium]|nr:glycosyltransferase family 4 protein [Verrucomicrobiae bacterium]